MKTAIVGSRSFKNNVAAEKQFYDLLDKLLSSTERETIISGGAAGPDQWAEHYAKNRGCSIIIHYPDWSKGKGAGYARNKLIIGDADRVLVFWDEKSKGTMNDIALAEEFKKPVRIYCWKNGKWTLCL